MSRRSTQPLYAWRDATAPQASTTIRKSRARIDDARAFFEQAAPGYDLVCFGLLDSHGLFSSMANIRLDGFVYTVEGIGAASRLLNDRGVLTLSFARAGGSAVACRQTVSNGHRGHGSEAARLRTRAQVAGPSCLKNSQWRIRAAAFGEFVPWHPSATDLATPVASDDWPYLYLLKRTIPTDYVLVILSLLAISIVAVARLKPAGSGREDFALRGDRNRFPSP